MPYEKKTGRGGLLAVGADEFVQGPDSSERESDLVRELVELRRGLAEERAHAQVELERTTSALHAAQEAIVRQERLAAVGQLAAGVAHDFNNTLATISGSAEVLLTDPYLDERAREAISDILFASRRGAHLIRQILDFSRKTIRHLERVSAREFVRQQAKLLRHALPETIQLDVSDFGAEAVVRADPAQLQQVIMNLAVNARDAMPDGGKLYLSAGLEHLSRPVMCDACGAVVSGDWVEIAVRDTGGGIPESVRLRMFEPYFTTKPVGSGTGLGLSQVLGIVQQHEGHLRVDTVPGAGTTIRVFLARDDGPLSFRPIADEPELVMGHGETIILVEDEPSVMRATRRMMEQLGYRVLVAERAIDALALVHSGAHPVDLIISDVVMPDMSGDALFAALKKESADVRVILMSGYPLGDESRHLLDEGLVAWLQKPVSLAQLSETIAHALTG